MEQIFEKIIAGHFSNLMETELTDWRDLSKPKAE